jgi:hypothetical protein
MTHYRMHRGWMDNPAFGGEREPFCRRAAWCWLIENANWKAAKVDAGGRTITVERGQLCVSYRYLAKAWGWSVGKVQLFIDRLKTDTMINTVSNTGRMVITICNYDRYQAGADNSNTPDNTVANTPSIRRQYESKEGKKERRNPNGEDSCGGGKGGAGGKPAPAPDPRQIDLEDYPGVKGEQPRPPAKVVQLRPVATMPDDAVLPDSYRQMAVGAGHPDPEAAWRRFRNHWLDKADRGIPDAAKSAAGWERAWDDWITDDVKTGKGKHHGHHHHRGQRAAATGANATAELIAGGFGPSPDDPDPVGFFGG